MSYLPKAPSRSGRREDFLGVTTLPCGRASANSNNLAFTGGSSAETELEQELTAAAEYRRLQAGRLRYGPPRRRRHRRWICFETGHQGLDACRGSQGHVGLFGFGRCGVAGWTIRRIDSESLSTGGC